MFSNIFQLAGIIFLYEGTRRFFKYSKRNFFFYGVALLFVLLMVYFTLFNNNIEARVLAYAFSFSFFYASIGVTFFRSQKGQGRETAVFIGLTLMFMSLMLLLRFLVVAFSDVDITFTPSSIVNVVILMVGMLVTLFFAYGLALLISQRLNDELKTSRNHFRLIFDMIPNPIAITEKISGKIIDVNEEFLRTMGYQRNEVLGEIPLKLGLWKDKTQREAFFNEINAKGHCYNFETTFKSKDDNDVVALFSGVAYQSNNHELLLSVANDITGLRRIEEEAHVLKRAVEQSPASILVTNSRGEIIYVNPWFTNISGYTFDEVNGKNPNVLQSGNMPADFYKDMWSTILKGKEWHGEFENRKKSGEIFWESASISGVTNDKGEITHFVAVKEDITQQKIFREELRLKNEQLNELNAQKDRLFSIISHDLRGPFNGFLGLTNLMADDAESMSKDEMVEIASGIRKSASTVFELLNNLLDWSRSQQGLIPFHPETVNINFLLNDCFENLTGIASNKNIELVRQNGDDINCFADVNMLKTIVRNLVSNALKFTKRGGKITVRVQNENEKVRFSIIDNGIGMSKDIVDGLFYISKKINRVGTDNEPSSGLGLIICYDFVKRNGGEIWAESIEGEGTAFHFTMPGAF
ncbi:MAG: PAS domain S-box protein [Prolixibacteraceae bacterium]|nr:PAS domain S-box protein [Prolixibacteraceae bacterium]MBN2648549.1 PAS domain S-box protein [Prolixibacteraceae bacterium]